MPVTPFHMGPGILIKAILQGFFSLIIFGWAQVWMDIQPLLAMLTGKGELHGFSHTYIGATLIAIFCALTGKWIYKVIMKMCGQNFTEYQKKLFAVSGNLTTSVCITSAFIGTFSHVLLDSIMHGDVEPFYPIIPTNHLHLLLSIEGLYGLCIYAGIAGGAIYFTIRSLRGIQPRP
ncbi:MAG: hypothetical protein A3H91_01145 [Gammaproteobacteria bacterium RIFCSPLOWO2_02_FULL_61_13]|nr:MAG: hypothetical protein A3H91_01145 [Gammaproteobacteria bacterium RIFCSPLOWO2_02_FULL_61_13]